MSHEYRKVDTEEWVDIVKAGNFIQARKDVSGKRVGPLCVLCDNEAFLHSRETKKLHMKKRISLWHIPPRSPDLNPVERYWSYVRRQLRSMDMRDIKEKHPAID